ncbi:MAG: RHS repeat protein, partial [Candidatus Electrothrix sp. AUS1_2]|nr:RHS repeat protein [Candidatus Electrothrix sp. AUS1_2]
MFYVERTKPDEKLGCSPCEDQTCVDIQSSSVNVTNGNLFDAYEISPDKRLPVTLSYNSRSTRSSRFGQGWNDSFDIRLISGYGGSMTLINPDGREDVFTRNSDGSFTPPPGIHDTLEGNSTAGYTLHKTGGGTILFNGQGKPLELRDSNGNSTSYSYAGDLLASVTDPYGNTLTFTHDGNGHVTGFSDALGRSSSFAYDAAGNLAEIIDSKGSRRAFSYDGNSNLIERTDPSGGVTRYTYDAEERLISADDALGATRTVSYESDSLTVLTDPEGNRTEYAYNEHNDLTRETSPLGNVTEYERDEDRNLIKEIDPEGHATVREYDDAGNPVKTIDPMGNETLTEYAAGSGCSSCGSGKPTRVTDAQGNVTEYSYDEFGNRNSTRDALGNVSSGTYDAKGRLLAETGPDGAVTRYEYDA